MFWQPLFLSLKLAFFTTVALLIIAIPLSYWLSKSKSRLKPILEAVVSLPLVLPPTVIGFYFLVMFGQSSSLGSFLSDTIGLELIFSFQGLVFASIIYSMPFMVHPIQAGLSSLPSGLEEASWVLGRSKLQTLLKVLLPNIKASILTGIVLSFAHTVGEFGVVLMIGGNIPGVTEVASIAIYKEVESMNYSMANKYSAILLAFAFIVLFFVYASNRRASKTYWK